MNPGIHYALDIFWRNGRWLFDNYEANNMLLMTIIVALLKSGRNYA
jgi:hypothetical protein